MLNSCTSASTLWMLTSPPPLLCSLYSSSPTLNAHFSCTPTHFSKSLLLHCSAYCAAHFHSESCSLTPPYFFSTQLTPTLKAHFSCTSAPTHSLNAHFSYTTLLIVLLTPTLNAHFSSLLHCSASVQLFHSECSLLLHICSYSLL